MVDRCGAERIGRADVYFLARFFQLCGQLTDRRGLAHTVDADDHHYERLPVPLLERQCAFCVAVLLQHRGNLFAQDRVQLGGIHVLVRGYALFDAFDDPHGRIDAHVRGDQYLFQVIEHLLVDLRLAGHGTREFREDAFLGLFQALVEVGLVLFLRENIE